MRCCWRACIRAAKARAGCVRALALEPMRAAPARGNRRLQNPFAKRGRGGTDGFAWRGSRERRVGVRDCLRARRRRRTRPRAVRAHAGGRCCRLGRCKPPHTRRRRLSGVQARRERSACAPPFARRAALDGGGCIAPRGGHLGGGVVARLDRGAAAHPHRARPGSLGGVRGDDGAPGGEGGAHEAARRDRGGGSRGVSRHARTARGEGCRRDCAAAAPRARAPPPHEAAPPQAAPPAPRRRQPRRARAEHKR
mmetsp:Transcript_1520/g.5602  ORF Transcript_1520/g.5602 Transcript_1520/m.5602 type:complete len:252 (-) Transcript_1520:902-1657(-)